jgi:hypothetical protein
MSQREGNKKYSPPFYIRDELFFLVIFSPLCSSDMLPSRRNKRKAAEEVDVNTCQESDHTIVEKQETSVSVPICAVCSAPHTDVLMHQRRCAGIGLRSCTGCDAILPTTQLELHQSKCEARARYRDTIDREHVIRDRKRLVSKGILTNAQLAAVQHVAEASKPLSDAAEPLLLERFAVLGFDAGHVRRLLAWLRNDAPILLHTTLARCNASLLSDTHYKNLFQTHRSGGSTDIYQRARAEHAMFGYHEQDTPGAERVKYGCLNLTQNPGGVYGARNYGSSFFRLHSSASRLRVTLSWDDSLSLFVTGKLNANVMATCDALAHFLVRLTDTALLRIMGASLGLCDELQIIETTASSAICYVEAQIHGPVTLAHDLVSLHVGSHDAEYVRIRQAIKCFRAQPPGRMQVKYLA